MITVSNELLQHIHKTWAALTRDLRNLPDALFDNKVATSVDNPPVLYHSPLESREDLSRGIEEKLGEATPSFRLSRLPADWHELRQHGLLYLPGAYVVPGGRFNEMYGWDSYFIVRGLLLSGEVELAKSVVDQQLYEVKHYGMVLNANRSYYLTRSNPPFLSRKVAAVFEKTKDLDWLRRALPLLEKTYYLWTNPPHLVPGLGLSRYHALGEGPAPEVLFSEKDAEGQNHYDRVLAHLQSLPDQEEGKFRLINNYALSYEAYVGDRSMRESGFDPTMRFGVCGLEAQHYIPVCLNSLLYQFEKDIARFYQELNYPVLSEPWIERAETRKKLVDEFLWDAESGAYFDYHLQHDKRSDYLFATTFWPLWAGLASQDQAARVVKTLDQLEGPGGLLTSPKETGCQWDAPFSWAPLVSLAVRGLHQYGFQEEAQRLGSKFVDLVEKEFRRTGAIFEKYDAARQNSESEESITFGYSSNEPGFGWTNGTLLELHDLFQGASNSR